jgi:hypothetical protein
MKRCPTCQRLFTEANFKFCRSDGAPLVTEVSIDEAPTVLFSTIQIIKRFPWLVRDLQSNGKQRPQR